MVRRPLWPLCLRLCHLQLFCQPRPADLAQRLPPPLALLLPPRHRPPHHQHGPRPLVPPHPVASHVPLHLLAPHAEAVPGHVPPSPLPNQPRRGSRRPGGSSAPTCPAEGCSTMLRGSPD